MEVEEEYLLYHYKILNNNVELASKLLSDLRPQDVFELVPKTTIVESTLLYHVTTATESYESRLGRLPKYKDEPIALSFNPFDMTDRTSGNYLHVLWNFESLEVLDFVPLTVDMRINFSSFDPQKYCKKQELDGYIMLDNNIPILYLINIKGFGINKLKLMGILPLKTIKNIDITTQQLIKLIEVFFCQIEENLEEVTMIDTIYGHQLILPDDKEIENLYDDPEIAKLFVISTAELSMTCPTNFDWQPHDIEFTEQNSSDALFKLIIAQYAKQLQISSFVLLLPPFPSYGSEAELIEYVRKREDLIIGNLFMHYKQSKKGKFATINLYQLSFIPKTYKFMKSEIFGVLSTLKDKEADDVINGKIIKSIAVYFNVDQLYHRIIQEFYDNPKDLMIDMINDLTVAYDNPKIDLVFIKLLANEDLLEHIEDTMLNIYQYYLKFIKNELLLDQLYELMKIKEIYEYLNRVAIYLNINPSLILYYSIITNMAEYKSFDVKKLKKDSKDIEFSIKEWFEKLAVYIVSAKLMDLIINSLKLDANSDVVKKFVSHGIEKMILMNQTLIGDLGINWLIYVNQPLNSYIVEDFIRLYEDRGILIEAIYQTLDVPLTGAIKEKALEQTERYDLFRVWMEFLTGSISRKEIEKIVLVKERLDEKKEKSKKKEKKKDKKKKKEEETEEEEVEETEEDTEELEY